LESTDLPVSSMSVPSREPQLGVKRERAQETSMIETPKRPVNTETFFINAV
jgi:hypothetical protein